MPNKWITKPVAFDQTNPEEMELYQYAKSLPNFTVMVKEWLKERRYGRHPKAIEPLDNFIQQPEECPSEIVEFDDGQFF